LGFRKKLLKLFGNKRNKTIDFQIMDRGVGVVRVVDPFGLVPYFKDKKSLILINRLYLSKIFQSNHKSLFCLTPPFTVAFLLYKQIKNVCVIHFLNVYLSTNKKKIKNGNINIKTNDVGVRFN
jgi:hypothetical protein